MERISEYTENTALLLKQVVCYLGRIYLPQRTPEVAREKCLKTHAITSSPVWQALSLVQMWNHKTENLDMNSLRVQPGVSATYLPV